MASPTKRISSKAVIFTLLVVFVCVCNASVTWRRVRPTRPSLTSTTTAKTESTLSTTTRSPVTWKRSTLPRRSTTTVQRRDVRAQETEVDNEQAEAKQDLAVVKDDESAVKPLAPGSRPGFWFDSARRRRPGTRKNSLFPAKPSAGTTPLPQTESVTSTTALPLTTTPLPVPKEDDKTSLINSKTRLFGRNRSTKTPITFRKRLRTTSTPYTSSTTETPEVEEQLNTNIPSENENDKEEEKQNNLENEADAPDTKESSERTTVNSQSSIRRPGFGTKRRFRNSTRPLWSRDSGRLNAKTTTPISIQSKTTSTTVPPHQDARRNYRTSTVSSRVRTRTKISRTTASPQVSWRKSHRTTERPETPIQKGTGKRRPQKNSLGNKDTFVREKPNVPFEAEFEPVVKPDAIKDDGLSRSVSRKYTSVVKTTVEPFYITRDYGRIATALPDYYQTRKNNFVEVTTVPSTSTITTTEPQDIPTVMEVNSTPLEDVDASLEETEAENEEPVFYSTVKPTEISSLPSLYGDKISQNIPIPTKGPGIKPYVFQDSTSSTKRPVVKLDKFSANPGANAYVVWSLGQGGSGWSFQKNGDQVKWSAQNSEAEGDRWSVEGKDKDSEPKQPLWAPVRNSSNQFTAKQIEYTLSKPSHGSKNVFTIKENLGEEVEPVTYIPNIPYRNETIVSIKSTSLNIPSSENIQFPEFPPGLSDSTPLNSPNSSEVMNSEDANDEQTVADGESLSAAEQPTLIPPSPTNTSISSIESTLDNGYAQHLFEIQEKELQSQFSPSYPYIAEIRDTFNNFEIPSTNNPANTFEVQEYITETPVPEISGHTYPLSPTLPSPQIQYFIQDFGQNVPSTILPEFGIDASVSENFPDNIDSIEAGPETYLDQHFDGETGIPPELAKAVVEAKKWNVVGTGGEDGWSLLGEDGRLEWKIHNVNGQWQVTSADQLINANAPDMPPPREILMSSDRSANQNSAEFKDVELKKPKVWTLDDDYDKWRTVSAERRVPDVESSAEKWSPLDKFQYGKNSELRGDYYTNDDYSYAVPDGFYKPYSSQEAFADRPFWSTGENKMVKSDSSDRIETYPRFKETVEAANTKKEAIEAWKALLAEHGNWKLSGKTNRVNKVTSSGNLAERREYDTNIDDKSKFSDNESSSEQQVHNARNNKQTSSSVSKRPEHSVMNDFKADPKHHRHYPEDHSINKYVQKNKSSVRYQEQLGSSQHQKTNDGDSEQSRRKYNGNFETNLKNEEFNNEQPYEADFQFDNEEKQKDSNNYQHRRTENGPVQEPSGIKIATKSVSKVDSLINKLETIQKESKGRAVMDLSELLKLIKANRNSSISKSQTKGNIDNVDMARKQEHIRSRNKHIRNDRTRNISKVTTNSNRPDDRAVHAPKEFSQDVRFDKYETSSEEEFTPYGYDNGRDRKIHNSESKTNLYETSTHNERQLQINPKSGRNRGSIKTTSQRQHNRANQNIRHIDAQEVNRNRYLRPKTMEKIKSEDYIPEVIERRYTIPQERKIATSYSNKKRLHSRPVSKTIDTSSSEELESFREKQNYLNDDSNVRNHRTNRKGPQRSHHHSPPIVLSGETDVEDEGDGSKKSRKIIVIDYAGKQKNSPIERKDLELIIRNVKHRRSKLLKDSSEEEPEK